MHSQMCVLCQWSDCQVIGRDLIRLLQSVARIPEFEELWKDLLQNPSSLSPQFTGRWQAEPVRGGVFSENCWIRLSESLKVTTVEVISFCVCLVIKLLLV